MKLSWVGLKFNLFLSTKRDSIPQERAKETQTCKKGLFRKFRGVNDKKLKFNPTNQQLSLLNPSQEPQVTNLIAEQVNIVMLSRIFGKDNLFLFVVARSLQEIENAKDVLFLDCGIELRQKSGKGS